MSPAFAAEDSQELFGAVHLAVLGLTALLGFLVIMAGRRLRGAERAQTATRGAGWLLLAASIVWMVWKMLPGNWTLDDSLPLHYSDALRLITAIALVRTSRWAVGITYYWGLTLNTQAMITPHPSQLELFSLNFVFYWGLHIAVLLAVLWLISGLGFRLGWKDFFIAYAAALLWAGLVMPLNAVLGTNYGFLNRHPQGASLLDYLGPWPLYVLWLVVLAGVVWALMTCPWIRGQRTKSPSADKLGP